MIVVNVDQPWPFAVCHLGCDVLNMDQPMPDSVMRPRRDWVGAQPLPPLRVLLRTGDEWDPDHAVLPNGTITDAFVAKDGTTQIGTDGTGPFVPLGAVVAVVEITGCHDVTIDHPYGTFEPCSPWAIGRGKVWHWTVGGVSVLPTPIPTSRPSPLADDDTTRWVVTDIAWMADADLNAAVKEQTS